MNEIETFENQGAQGDILIRRIDTMPTDVVAQEPIEGRHIVAHSETGHHHTLDSTGANFYRAANDPMIMYLVVDDEVDLIHNRSFDTHKTLRIPAGTFEIRRQREYTPEGWRMVED